MQLNGVVVFIFLVNNIIFISSLFLFIVFGGDVACCELKTKIVVL